MELNAYLFIVCSATYATLSALIAIQARGRTNLVLASGCGVTALWAACSAVWSQPTLQGAAGLLDLIRLSVWYYYLLHLYRQSEIAPSWQVKGFGAVA